MSISRFDSDRPVITAWTAVSPFGMGRSSFVEGLAASRNTAVALDRETWNGPAEQACLVPGFQIREVLGKKGTRSMDRVTALALSAVGQLVSDAEGNRLVEAGEDTGLVLGTSFGSAQSMMDFTRSSLLGNKPFYVDPAVMPNSVMNCAAGQCAIWYQLRGPNTTIAGGNVAGHFALKYARRLLSNQRAGQVLVGAAEEYSAARAWLAHQGRGGAGRGPVLGEGCAVLLMESPGAVSSERPPLAEVLALESRVFRDGDFRSALVASVRGALDRAGVDPQQVWAVSPAGTSGLTGQYEREVLDDLFGATASHRLALAPLIGDAGAAATAMQVASVLAVAERAPEAAGRVAVVTSVDQNGTVACALLRTLG